MSRTPWDRRRFLQRALAFAAGAAFSERIILPAMGRRPPVVDLRAGFSGAAGVASGSGTNVGASGIFAEPLRRAAPAASGTAGDANDPVAAEQPSALSRASSARMPVVFLGHGSPMNAIEDNTWSRSFRKLAGELPRPKAVAAVSAHWFIHGTEVTGQAQPPTIHDFGGFPQALYDMQYPAPGSVELAGRIVKLLGPDRASVSHEWGLDHGTWSVLVHLLPQADVPVVQISIDADLPAAQHLEIGRALAPLRDEGVLILGSGNITHNLPFAFRNAGRGELSLPEWAASYDRDVARALEQHDGPFLARILTTENGRMSHPTPDHYLPLLYVAGAVQPDDGVRFPITGFDFGSLSMRAVVFEGS